MIIYEVNLTIDKTIFQVYYDWLESHVADMLAFDGFVSANICSVQSDLNESYTLCVSYYVLSRQHLNEYLAKHASTMRESAVKKFGTQFKATRRVLTALNIFNKRQDNVVVSSKPIEEDVS